MQKARRYLFWMAFLILTPVLLPISGGARESLDSTPSPSFADIMLVIDNSGSMKKNDPDFLARDFVTAFLGMHLKKMDSLGTYLHIDEVEEGQEWPGFKPRTTVGLELEHIDAGE